MLNGWRLGGRRQSLRPHFPGGVLRLFHWCLKLPQVKLLCDRRKRFSSLPFCILNPEENVSVLAPPSAVESIPCNTSVACISSSPSTVAPGLRAAPASQEGQACRPEPAGSVCSSPPASYSDIVGSLKSATMGVFIPQKLANTTNQGAFVCFIFLESWFTTSQTVSS